MNPIPSALHDWQTFYAMVGAASATLIGLLFVAVSFGTSELVIQHGENIQTFVTPTVVHFIAVLIIAAIMLAPTHTPLSLTGFLALCGVIGVGYAGNVTWRMIRHPQKETIDKGHWAWHAALPSAAYGFTLIAGIAVQTDLVSAFNVLAFAVMAMLIIGIHNAWDLAQWIMRNRG